MSREDELHLGGKFNMDEKGLYYTPIRGGGRARPIDVIDGELVFAGLPRSTQPTEGGTIRSAKRNNSTSPKPRRS